MFFSRLIATGSYLPSRKLTNSDLEKMVDTSDGWIMERTGIKERRITNSSMASSDLAVKAAEKALENSGFDKNKIDLIIVTTSSQDMIFPATACLVQDRLGLNNRCPAFDVMAACTGFIYGLQVADSMIKSGQHKNVLLIGADAMSRMVDWSDRNTCILFGDGAGAVILSASKSKGGVLGSFICSDGSGSDLLKIPAGGSKEPCSQKVLNERQHYIKMNGNEVFKFAVKAIPQAVEKVLKMSGYRVSDIDYLIPHQANSRIINTAVKKLGIDPDRVVTNLEYYGNTSAASIPIALDELNRSKTFKDNQIICLVGFGAGLTWGASILKWNGESES